MSIGAFTTKYFHSIHFHGGLYQLSVLLWSWPAPRPHHPDISSPALAANHIMRNFAVVKQGGGEIERHSGRGGVRRENRDPDADADRWREGSWRGAGGGGGGGGGGVWEVGRNREREAGDITSGGDHPVSDGHYCCGRGKLLRTRKIFFFLARGVNFSSLS